MVSNEAGRFLFPTNSDLADTDSDFENLTFLDDSGFLIEIPPFSGPQVSKFPNSEISRRRLNLQCWRRTNSQIPT